MCIYVKDNVEYLQCEEICGKIAVKPWIIDLICQKFKSWYTTMLLEIVRPSCYQISKEILKFTKHYANMHMWDFIDGSGFGVADDLLAALYHISISNCTTIQYHWGEFFPHYIANRMYFQFEIKVGIFKKDLLFFSFFFNHSLPVLHMTWSLSIMTLLEFIINLN